ncbi:MAG: TonB-dependent receptor [Opitutaceae bacterium]|nr:TonB-dependent receptor [Opitutaceae bacterium]
MILAGSPGLAQVAPEKPIRPAEEVLELEKVKVEGFRQGLAKAREDQRRATNLKEIMSVDAAGKLPDSNVAEALQRLPSAYLSNSRGGDGRYISVRGIDPVLNNVTMNGQTIGVSDVDGRSGRAAPLDVLSSSALQSIEVIKSATPDMDAQGLGATINITAPSAFDHKGWFLYGSGKVGYNEYQSNGDIQEGDFNFGTTFGARNQFGLVIGASYSYRDFTSFEVSREGYRVFGRSPNQYFDVNGVANPYGVIAVSADMTLRTFLGNKERKGGNLNFEWRPADGTEFWVRGFKTDYREYIRKSQLRLRTANLNVNQTRFLSPTEMFTTRGAVETETEYGDTYRPVDQLTIGGRRRINEAWTIDGNITLTGAEEDKPNGVLLADEFSNNNFQNGLGNVPSNATFSINTSGLFPIYRTVFDDPVRGWPGTGDIGDLSFYPFFRIRHEFSHVKEETETYDLNVKWDRELGGKTGFLKAGVKVLDRAKSVDDRSLRYLPNSTLYLSDSFVDGSTRLPYGIMNSDLVGRFPIGPADGLYARYLGATHNTAAFDAEFARNIGTTLDQQYNEVTNTPNPATSIKNPSAWTFDTNGSRQNSVEDDYDLTEKILAYYVMGDYDLTRRVKLVAGARVEHTEAKMSAFVLQDLRANGTFSLLPNGPVDKSFTNVLPAVHLRWEVSDRILARLSYTTSIGRPDYKDMAPIGRSFQINSGPAANIYTGSLQEGNPSLEPYESQNFDASVAYYFAQGRGMISLGAFYKDIKNAIYDFGYNPLTDDVNLAGKDYTRSTVNGIPIVTFRGFQFSSLSIATKNNAPRSHVSGVEITYQQDLTFLPAPFDGLGLATNVALMESKAKLLANRPTGANEVPFFLQPDLVANAQLYYQYRGFEARVAWHYQDDALAFVGADPLIDKFWRARHQFDAKVSCKINANWGVFAEGRNLTDEPNRTFFAYNRNALGGQDSQPGYDVTGMTVYFGVSYHFGQ